MESIQQTVQETQDRIINKPSRWFGMVPAWIIDYVDKVGGSGISVFTVLCIHASKEKRCYPSIPTISKESGFSEATVKEALKKLIENSLIRKIEQGNGRGHANLYEICDLLEKGSPVSPFPLKGSESGYKGVRVEAERGRQLATNISNEHIHKQSVEIEKPSVSSFQSVSPSQSELKPTATFFSPAQGVTEAMGAQISDEQFKKNREAIERTRQFLKEREIIKK